MSTSKNVVQCKKYPITYTLVIKKVKNINMRISQNGEIVVSANPFIPMEKIDDFVSSKVSWIIQHQKQIVKRQSFSIYDENHIMLFGNHLRIKRSIGKYNHVSYDKSTLLVQCRGNANIDNVISQFLDKLCKDVFMDIVSLTHRSLENYHLPFPELKIREMKSRWGSCTPVKNSITLNKKLIHYPFEFIEYVVLHEFIHFIQPNHSKAFYHIIENYMPDYKARMDLINHLE